MASQRSKQVEVKLSIDGETIRLRFACKGHLATESFSDKLPLGSVAAQRSALEWLSEQFDDQLNKLKEVANGPTR